MDDPRSERQENKDAKSPATIDIPGDDMRSFVVSRATYAQNRFTDA
jgi:hypothetical protein